MKENKIDVLVEKRIAVTPLRRDKYGTVEGLDRDELLDPAELERLVYRGMFEPLLFLSSSVRGFGRPVRPAVDIDGFVDYGAFDTVDFKRLVPSFDKARYKIDMLRDELADSVMRLEMVSERIKSRKKYLIMKYLKEDVLELDDIKDMDMWCMGRMYLRMLRLKREIKELQEYRSKKFKQQLKVALG